MMRLARVCSSAITATTQSQRLSSPDSYSVGRVQQEHPLAPRARLLYFMRNRLNDVRICHFIEAAQLFAVGKTDLRQLLTVERRIRDE